MILVWGPGDDPPLERVVTVLRNRKVDVAHLEDRDLATLEYDIVLSPKPTGWLSIAGRKVQVDEVESIYLRPGETTAGAPAAAAMTLLCLAAIIPAAVVNRPVAGRSNWSKPLQLSLLSAAGLRVPETLVTTDPDAAKLFLARHRRLVYKSVSGIRSIVSTLDAGDASRLDAVRTGPVQLQRWIDGLDVRVHVVGEQWFATAIESDACDYRYGMSAGYEVRMAPFALPPDLGRSLVQVSHDMGLLVSGVDLRLTPTADWYAFEVNPSPGFTFYEEGAGQPIGDAIADLLIGDRAPSRPSSRESPAEPEETRAFTRARP